MQKRWSYKKATATDASRERNWKEIKRKQYLINKK